MKSDRPLLYFSLLLIFCLFPFSLLLSQSTAGIATVVIDPGHGGSDPGAVSPRNREKDITLAVSLKLGELIRKHHPEVRVLYTRSNDKKVALYDRPEFANNHNADLFISIHVNAAKSGSSATGTETWVMGTAKSAAHMELVQSENAVILLEDDYSTRYQGFDPNSPASYIMFSMMQNAYLQQSVELASMVQESFRSLNRTDRGVKQGGLLVLWRTTMPAILVELGFISNPSEERYLISQNGQDQLAGAIYVAFKRYKAQVDSRSVFVPGRSATQTGTTAPASSMSRDSAPASSSSSEVSPVARVSAPSDVSAPTVPEKSSEAAVATSGIWFYVQIMASPKPIPLQPSRFKNLSGVEEIRMSATLYKYVVLKTRDYQGALQEQRRVRTLFPDAFVFAMKEGKIIPVNDALKELKP